jgi:hypothetical protein
MKRADTRDEDDVARLAAWMRSSLTDWPATAGTYEEWREFFTGHCGVHPMEGIHQSLLDAWFEYQLVRYEDHAAILRAARQPFARQQQALRKRTAKKHG